MEEKIDTNFDENSLEIYGAMLGEQLDKQKPGKERATPQALVGEILTEQETEIRRQQ